MFASCHLTSLVTRTNHNTIDVYVRIIRTDYHAGQIFIPHRHGPMPDFLFGLIPIARILSQGNPLGSGLLFGGLYSPSHLSVNGCLQGLMRMVTPPTSLLHPGREAAVGPRLLIRREDPAYFAANLYI